MSCSSVHPCNTYGEVFGVIRLFNCGVVRKVSFLIAAGTELEFQNLDFLSV